MSGNKSHEHYMRLAYNIATSNIDPIGGKGVGAILVDREHDKIIGSGCRWTYLDMLGRQHKTVHAELMAIQDSQFPIKYNLKNADLYVTMEPCVTRWHNSICWH